MSDLKPCPFCGGESEYEEFNDGFFSWGRVECQCGVMLTTPPNVTIEAWNTRKPMDLIKKEISELADVDGNAYLDCADVLEIIEKVEGGT